VAARPGWCVAIATGHWRRAASLKLGCARIAIPAVAACSEDGESRSAVLAAAIASAKLAAGTAAFDRVIYVGDQPWDLRAARDQDAAFLGIGSDARARRLEEHGARVIGSYADAATFLAALEEVAALA
jgi:phosphoglycolate phosphatase-like HAD superfamily hydrolase